MSRLPPFPNAFSCLSLPVVGDSRVRYSSIVKIHWTGLGRRNEHAAGSKSTGEELRPTVLVLFGNSKAGTPLMVCG